MTSYVSVILLGVSLLVATISMVYVNIDTLFKHGLPPSGNNSIFNAILSSFSQGLESPPFALKTDFGLITRNPFSENQSILSISFESSQMIIDGDHGVPSQLASSEDFGSLSPNARTVLSIAVLKSTNDEFPNPFSLLWKAAGVRPLPDNRWIVNKGLFSLPRNSSTGVSEIDREVKRAHTVVDECMAYVRFSSSRALRTVTETELQWSWIFLNAFGVPLTNQRKIIIGPLVFARHTADAQKAVGVALQGSRLTVTTSGKMERGDEILVDGSLDVTDGYAWLYHGSWIADDSLHRGRFSLEVDPSFRDSFPSNFPQLSEGELKIWLSNDPEELETSRKDLHSCVQAIVPGGDRSEASHQIRVLGQIVHMLKTEVRRLGSVGDNAVKFHYANLLLNEVGYWEALRRNLIKQQVEV